MMLFTVYHMRNHHPWCDTEEEVSRVDNVRSDILESTVYSFVVSPSFHQDTDWVEIIPVKDVLMKLVIEVRNKL